MTSTEIPPLLNGLKEQEPLAVELISRAWKNKRFSHAYIFSGLNHDKVMEFIQVFAKILLCDSVNGVDNCPSCHAFESEQHPDYRIWAPDTDKSKFIKLEQVQQLISTTQKKPVTSKHQVLILDQINMLRMEGSNALLKTLEEPAHYTTIILTVDTLDNVLPTILSRCQIIPVKSVREEVEEESFNLDEYTPSSYGDAAIMAKKNESLSTDELVILLTKIQSALWNRVKEKYNENMVDRQVEIITKIENYLKYADSYVNQKILLENIFITLFEAKKLF